MLHDYFQNGEYLKFRVMCAGKAAKSNAKNVKTQSLGIGALAKGQIDHLRNKELVYHGLMILGF